MYIERSLETTLKKYLRAPEIIAVVGARQVGKTTLLEHIRKGVRDSIFVTFEDAEARALFSRDVSAFVSLYIQPYKYIFLDEFQYAKNGGKTLKYIYDTVKGRKIFISGSSVLDLTVSAVKHLAGRILSFTLYPLSFDEYIGYKDPALAALYRKGGKRSKYDDVVVKRFRVLLHDFIVFGGYPRVAVSRTAREKEEILRNLLNVYLLKDVRDILGLSDDYRMLSLIKALALQAGNVVSYQELAAVTQQSFPTLKRYLNLLEKTYIVNLVKPFYTNKRTELVKNPKAYFYDTGLRNAAIGDFKQLELRPDKGALLENFVFSELTKRGRGVKYWRSKSKAEVDFVVDDVIPVEVKSRLSRPFVEKSLQSFIEKYKPPKGYVLSENLRETIKMGSASVFFRYHFDRIP